MKSLALLRLPSPRGIVGYCLVALLASCSDASSFALPAEKDAVFSPEDKLAARKLSLGSNVTLEASADPYARALRCRNAMSDIADRLRQSAALSEMQIQAVDQAVSIYERQAVQLGENAGKSPSEIQKDLHSATQGEADAVRRNQLAIACIQRLQS